MADDAFSHVTDLSQSWFDSTGLPFVFARWVVSKRAAPPVKTAIARWLDEFKAKEALLVAQAAPRAAPTLGIPLDLIQRYFRVIRWCLDDSDIRGQRQFLADMQRFGRRPLFQTVA
jgi:chorismate dehydratase